MELNILIRVRRSISAAAPRRPAGKGRAAGWRAVLPAAAAACFAGLLLAAAPGQGAEVKVRLGTLAPKGSSYTKHLQVMGEQWRKTPGGGAAVTIYADGTMGSEADMVRRMRLNQLQAAMVTAVGLSEVEPGASGLQMMPKVFRSLDELDYVTERLEPLLEKRLGAKGFVVLFWADTGFVHFFSKQPIVMPDDLRKSKLFVSAGRTGEMNAYRFVGCHPVPLEVADILPGLQTGLIDAVPMPATIALAIQLDSAAGNMLEMDWAPLVGAAIINKKTWDSLAPPAQEAMRKAARAAGQRIKADGRRENLESVDALRKRGLKVHTLTPEANAAWDEAVQKGWQKIRGEVVPTDIYDEVMADLKTFRATHKEAAK